MSERRLPVFPASEICAPCGGKCCKACPGSTSPEDWGAPDVALMRERLAAAFATGRWAVDLWYGEFHHEDSALHDDVLFVRAAERGYESKVSPFHELEGDDDSCTRLLYGALHPCTFHSDAGCELAEEVRPIECRALEPVPRGDCKPHAGGKRERALEWAPYQGLLRAVAGM